MYLARTIFKPRYYELDPVIMDTLGRIIAIYRFSFSRDSLKNSILAKTKRRKSGQRHRLKFGCAFTSILFRRFKLAIHR